MEVIYAKVLDISTLLPGVMMYRVFFGKGKLKAWDTWMTSKNQVEFTAVFKDLGNRVSEISDAQMNTLERFLISLYGGKEPTVINKLRQEKFKLLLDNDIGKIPTSKGALYQHATRSCYTSGFLWYEAVLDFELPPPTDFAYEYCDENNSFIPIWELTKSTVDVTTFIDTCSCGTKKCKNCKCAKAKVECLTMCKCLRECPSRKSL